MINFIQNSNQQMKMIGHQYPGIGIRNGGDVLVIQIQKIPVVVGIPEQNATVDPSVEDVVEITVQK